MRLRRLVLAFCLIAVSVARARAAAVDSPSQSGPPGSLQSIEPIGDGFYVLQADGSVVAPNRSEDGDSLDKLLSNGLSDAGFFFNRQTVLTNYLPHNLTHFQIRRLAIQPDGKFLVGLMTDPSLGGNYLPRIFKNGALDATFLPRFGFPASEDEPFVIPVGVLPDGGIFAAGTFDSVDGQRFPGLVLLNPDGSAATNFVAATNILGNHVAQVLPVANNRFLVKLDYPSPLFRLNSDGSLDSTFLAPFLPYIPDIVLDAASRILAAQSFQKAGGTTFSRILRWLPNGEIDQTFDSTLEFDGPVLGTAIDAEGRIILAGEFPNISGQPSGAIVRLLPNGQLDPTWNSDQIPPSGFLYNPIVRASGAIAVGASFDWPNPFEIFYLNGGSIARLFGPTLSDRAEVVRLSTLPGETWSLQRSEDLVNWTESNHATATDFSIEFDISSNTTNKPAFFRAARF